MSHPSVVFGVTAPEAIWYFLKEQAVYLADQGWQVHLVASPDRGYERLEELFSSHPLVHLHSIPMKRTPAPLMDLRSLLQWVALLNKVRPRVVVAGTPKAGLLGMLGGWIARTPVRVYQLRGLRLQTQKGLPKVVSWITERMASSAATHILSVSPSLRDEFSTLHLAPREKIAVIGSGSSHGVDTKYFRPPSAHERLMARQRFQLPDNDVAIGFAGRLSKDKGLPELLQAFAQLRTYRENVRLLVAGQVEDSDMNLLISSAVDADKHVRVLPWLEDLRQFYWSLDIFCLPSFREGLPNVNLEAAACGLPVVSSTATGCRDSLVDGVTGLLVAPGDESALQNAVDRLLSDIGGCRVMGREGRVWVSKNFEEGRVRSSLDSWLSSLVAD